MFCDEEEVVGIDGLDFYIFYMWNMCVVKREWNGVVEVWNIVMFFIIRTFFDFFKRCYILSYVFSEVEFFCF